MKFSISMNLPKFNTPWTQAKKSGNAQTKATSTDAPSKNAAVDSLKAKRSGSAESIVLGPELSIDAPKSLAAAKPAKTFKSQMMATLKVAGKGLTCVGIAPLVGVWAVASLAAAVLAPMVGAVVAFCSVLKEGPVVAALYAPLGFQEGLDMAQAQSKNALSKLTHAVGLTN